MYDDQPIVGGHRHLWDLEVICATPSWSRQIHTIPIWTTTRPCAGFTLPDEYPRDTALHNVVATVHIEAECARIHQFAETRWLCGIAACHGKPNV